MPKSLKYNIDILHMVSERDGGKVLEDYNKINTKTMIRFKCSCGNESSKSVQCLVEFGGMFCRKCTTYHKQNRTRATSLIKYGTDSPLQHKDVKEKRKKTFMNKYGVEYISQSDDIKNKKKISSINRYGVEYPLQHKDVIEKRDNTNLEKYGAKNQFQVDSIKEKIKQTNLEKYGVEYASQNIKVQEKIQNNSKKYKEYLMPSSTIRKVQGYEPFALDILVQQYNEEHIKTNRSDVPRIQYKVNEHNRYYFPDIFIPDEKRIIEVKSIWTYKCKTDNINIKKDACISQGYNYEIWCFNGKGTIIDVNTL